MSTRLFIAEKPSLAQAIAEQLCGHRQKTKTHIIVGSDIITWCFGHILEQAMPEDYNPDWRFWSKEHLPIAPSLWKLLPKSSARTQLFAIKELLNQSDLIVNAGDPDREGQLLVDEVLFYFGNKKPVKRILINDYNGAKVKQALATLKENNELQFRGWYESAVARSRFDWLFGLNLTRAYTLAARQIGYDGVLSIGRVQTPTLALVVSRDLLIENFKPTPFYTLTAKLKHNNGEFVVNWKMKPGQQGLNEGGYLINASEAEAVARKISGKRGKIIKYDKVSKNETPPNLFSLSGLIKATNNRFGYSAQAVLDTCQSLYETHKLTTYPRTDCEYVSAVQHSEAPEILNAIINNKSDLANLISKAELTRKSPAFNDEKVTAHHAIVPTTRTIKDGSRLSEMESNVYDLIVRAYIAQFLPLAQYLQTTIEVEIEDELFTARGKTYLSMGWRELYDCSIEDQEVSDEEKEPEQKLPIMAAGDMVDCIQGNVNHRKTNPPSRFTEGTLQDAMKDVHRFVIDPEIKKRLREGQGIGTEATRPGIIEELKKRSFLTPEKKGSKKIVSSVTARALISALPQPVKDPALTAICEQALELVAIGKLTCEDFIKRNILLITKLIEGVESTNLSALTASMTFCPKCKTGKLRRIKGKKGFFWSCSNYGSDTEKCLAIYPDKAGKADFSKTNSFKEKVHKKG